MKAAMLGCDVKPRASRAFRSFLGIPETSPYLKVGQGDKDDINMDYNVKFACF